MNNIKTKFSIRDLENLTGIKKHTIRIWEKRYNLLQPKRTDNNIRYYELTCFQKLLNVSYLNKNGHKISKIAKLSDNEIHTIVREIFEKTNPENHAINLFKLSMLNFDKALFDKTYEALLNKKTLTDVFYDVLTPLLTEIGLLWQTSTITPAHEHFITALIREKIITNTEKIQSQITINSNTTFVLYLPENEIHELGIIFINYQLASKGYRSIFLGQSVPLENLADLHNCYNEIIFISYFTVAPAKHQILNYISKVEKTLLLKKPKTQFWMLGQMLKNLNLDKLPKNIKPFTSINSLIKKL